jgi:prevent-host-death family protein
MQSIPVSDFRRQCLSLIDKIPPEGILITRRGEPVARLLPVKGSCAELIGSAPDLLYNNDDDLLSTGMRWDAES